MQTSFRKNYKSTDLTIAKSIHGSIHQKQSVLNKTFTQQFHPSRTVRLEKIKSQLADYLNRQTFTKNNDINLIQSSSIRVSPRYQKTSPQNQKAKTARHRYYYPSKNLYQQKKQKRKKLAQRINRSAEQNIQQISKQSFMIRQIKPEAKERFSKDNQIFTPGVGKVFGSYYQIVQIKNQLEPSRFYRRSRAPILKNCSPYLQQKYSLKNNPEFIKEEEHLHVKRKNNKNMHQFIEGGQIQPWKNLQQSNIDM